MYYLIIGILPGAFIADLQFFLCKKAKTKAAKLLPVFSSAGAFLLAEFIRGENFFSSAVYGFLGRGIFAAVAILWILGTAFAIGSLAGWAVYLIKKARNSA